MNAQVTRARIALVIVAIIAAVVFTFLIVNENANSSPRHDPGHTHGGNLGGPVHWGDGDGHFTTRGHHACACIRG